LKVIIIGAGVAGSVLSDILGQKGHEVVLIESQLKPGGMCKSYYLEGFVHEYGPHILANHIASKRVRSYLESKIKLVDTKLTSASFLRDTLTYYPPSLFSADLLGLRDIVTNELKKLPIEVDETNFETYLISKVGNTLYNLFFKGFTKKFWGINPSLLSSDWAKMRHLGEKVDTKEMFFNEKWCAYPVSDWNELFGSILNKVNVIYGEEVVDIELKSKKVVLQSGLKLSFDRVISTMHIDTLFNNKFGILKYAGYRIEPAILDRKSFNQLDNKPVSMTYYPEDNVPYCRITDYGSFQRKTGEPYNQKTIITYEYPDMSKRLYPFTDKINMDRFDLYLKEAAKYPDIITFGRMGLFKYLTTDSTIEMIYRCFDYFDGWSQMDIEGRYNAYKTIRGSFKN